jgi:putative ABC transport system permease protein
MAIPISYNLRNLVVRKTTTVMTAVGIAMTVAVLLAVLALVAGLRTAFASTGDPLHVLVLRKGGNAELTSLVTQQSFQIIKSFPGIAKAADGQPLASFEVVSVTNLKGPENPNGMNVTLRGLPAVGIQLRHLTLKQGRWFQQGMREVVVGKNIEKRYPDAKLGHQLRFGKGLWNVVGVLDGGTSAYNSEIWADVNQVASDFNRSNNLSSVVLQADNEVAAQSLIHALGDDRRLPVDAMTEESYFAQQMISAGPVRYLGIFVSIIMAIGSCFAAMNTMYAAVARRAKEVGTLRVLGFTRGSILFSFFVESILLSLIGGIIGILIVLPLNSVTTGVGNFMTFSETSFNFRVTPQIMIAGILFAALMGAIGGIFPARQAAKKEILTALREV